MKPKKKINVKSIIVVLILAVLIVVYYYYLSNKKGDSNEEGDVESTAVQNVLMRNLDQNYPPTPKEVIKYYSEISKCFYNEDYTEEELEQLALKAQELYDPELIANKTQEQYMEDLRADILEFQNAQYTIVSYSLSSSVDIENAKFTQDGYEWTRVYCTYHLNQGRQSVDTSEVFLLRKDENGHWKIYGWDLAD